MTDSVIGLDDPRTLRRMVDAYVEGTGGLTGLELYYELERSTPLLTFHTMMRGGARNRARSGLQQSYGDHNRLLMLGLDKLLEGDLDWYRTRIDSDDPVGDDALAACFRRVAALGLPRDVVVALWLAAALHDCGMLCGRGANVDVEDGIVLARPIIEELCPDGLDDLATFVLRHHDYIKGVFLGEVPAGLVADDVATLEQDQRAVALAALGFVQVAGAASLGEGRLGSFRVGVFERCVAGSALDDRRASTRLARLLGATPQTAVPTEAALPSQAVTERLLEHASVHGWQRVMVDVTPRARVAFLVELARFWADSGADHVVFDERLDPQPAPPDLERDRCRIETTLSGVDVLLIQPG